MLNKQEREHVALFMATIIDIAQELFDEVATFEAELQSSEADRKRTAQDRRLRNRRRTANRKQSHAEGDS